MRTPRWTNDVKVVVVSHKRRSVLDKPPLKFVQASQQQLVYLPTGLTQCSQYEVTYFFAIKKQRATLNKGAFNYGGEDCPEVVE
jgi:hypothetical protein